MSDTLLRLANDRRTARFVKMLGLPAPVILERSAGGYQARELDGRSAHCAAAPGGRLLAGLQGALAAAGADPAGAAPWKILVFDATGVQCAEDFRHLYDFFNPVLRQMSRNGRVVILGDLPEQRNDPVSAAAARGLEGFTRSLAKELGKRGSTANLFLVDRDGAAGVAGALQFFCSARSTYVDGQVVRISAPVQAEPPDRSILAARPPSLASPGRLPLATGQGRLAGRVALVTGAARGIGAATAERLAEEGATVVCLDIPADRDGLYETAGRIGGVPFTADVSDPASPQALCDFLRDKFGGVDVVVHNAGVTRDKTLANMPPHWWDQVLAINLRAILAIDAALLAASLLRDNGRIICLSSMGGFAGNYGQTNYAATKAALIGYVAAQAPRLGARGITANAVAPGFIETRMTAAMPLLPREVGRRMSSLAQGGQPRDVAELITFLATPEAAGVNGNTIRVCGQGWLGA